MTNIQRNKPDTEIMNKQSEKYYNDWFIHCQILSTVNKIKYKLLLSDVKKDNTKYVKLCPGGNLMIVD